MSKRPMIAAFLTAAAVFVYIGGTSTFGDADAFYHLEAAKLTAVSGPIREFPWLPFTTLADHFADHHFLYHLALVPFLHAFGDPWGLKTATILFASAAAAAFCWLLKDWGVRRPYAWTLPILLAPGLVFRMLLTKATSPALAALFLFLIALRRGNRPAVFAIAFAYVWLHGSWPLLAVVAVIDAVLRRSIRILAPAAAGLVAGLVVNPFFPDNLAFYWEQTVRIAIVGDRSFGVFVGNEWYPQPIHEMLFNNGLLFLPVFVVIGILARRVSENAPPPTVTPERRRLLVLAWAMAVLLMLMTMRQARHKEYALPMLVLAAALLWDTLTVPGSLGAAIARLRARFRRAFRPAEVLLAAAALFAVGHELWYARAAFLRAQPFTRFASAGEWMRTHVPKGEIVFHTAWDEFPILFYRDPEHRYIAGLDPRFLHRKDPALYWRWRDVSDGRVRIGLARAIEEGFGARYVFLETKDEPLLPLIKKDPSFERVYGDAEAEVWKITR